MADDPTGPATPPADVKDPGEGRPQTADGPPAVEPRPSPAAVARLVVMAELSGIRAAVAAADNLAEVKTAVVRLIDLLAQD